MLQMAFYWSVGNSASQSVYQFFTRLTITNSCEQAAKASQRMHSRLVRGWLLRGREPPAASRVGEGSGHNIGKFEDYFRRQFGTEGV